MRVGFSVVSRGDQVEFQLFGPRPAGRLPLVSFAREQGGCAVLMGRLYYRAELLARLGCPSSAGPTGDAGLALAAYRRQGLAGVAGLEGDFALVIWDAARDRLVAARDPLGGYPLFWATGDGTTAFSTSLGRLLDRRPRRLNAEYLAEYLMLPACFYAELPHEVCAFEGTRRVGPGCTLAVRLPAGDVAGQVRWDWLAQAEDPGTDDPGQLSAAYGERLRVAVRERLGGQVASHLSGGMDSTAVALVARDHLSAAGRGPLHTLSLMDERVSAHAIEAPYLESALAGQPGLVAHRLPAYDVLDFGDFADPPYHDEPYGALMRIGADRLLLEQAARVGADTVLTGHGADEIADLQPFYLADLLRRGRLWSAWSEAARWARAHTCSRWQILWTCGLQPLQPGWLQPGLLPLLRGGYAGWRQQNQWTVAPWINAGFARQHDLRGRALAHARRMYSACRGTALSITLWSVMNRCGDWQRWYLAAAHGQALAHPFLDPRLLRFGLGVHARTRPQPGRAKPLLADAMRDVLPESIRNRRRKGSHNEVYFRGLSRNLPALESLIHRAPADDLGLFDKDVLVQCLRQAALGVARDFDALDRLNLTLSLLRWLSLVEQGPGSSGEAGQVFCVRRGGAEGAAGGPAGREPACTACPT